MITAKYFMGYPPIKESIITIKKIIAVVEKLAGKISIKIKNTGAQSGNKRFYESNFFVLNF